MALSGGGREGVTPAAAATTHNWAVVQIGDIEGFHPHPSLAIHPMPTLMLTLSLSFFDLIIRLTLRMATSSSDAAVGVNDVADASADPLSRVAGDRGVHVSDISPKGVPGNVRAAHQELAHLLFNGTDAQDNICTQHICPLIRKPPFDAVDFDVPDASASGMATHQQVYEIPAIYRCITTQVALSAHRNIFHPLTSVCIARNQAWDFDCPVNSSFLGILHRERQLLNLPLEDNDPLNDDDRALYLYE